MIITKVIFHAGIGIHNRIWLSCLWFVLANLLQKPKLFRFHIGWNFMWVMKEKKRIQKHIVGTTTNSNKSILETKVKIDTHNV